MFFNYLLFYLFLLFLCHFMPLHLTSVRVHLITANFLTLVLQQIYLSNIQGRFSRKQTHVAEAFLASNTAIVTCLFELAGQISLWMVWECDFRRYVHVSLKTSVKRCIFNLVGGNDTKLYN